MTTNDNDPKPQTPDPNTQTPASSRGTPFAGVWDDDWRAKIEAVESRLERRICGARTHAGEPCELAPNHENGRCRFHGGFPLTGGQKNNRNAIVHGLYSRRLRTCGAWCPEWNACPCAGTDLKEIPQAMRPTCPFEQTEYNTALSDALDRVSRNPRRDGLDLHIAHNLALVQVMLNRAAVALRNAPLVDETAAPGGACLMKSSKPSAHLDAFTRIAREYRHFAALIKSSEPAEPELSEYCDTASRMSVDTGLDAGNEEHLHPVASQAVPLQARRYVRQAVEHASVGDETAALYAATDAMQIAPNMFDSADWKDLAPEADRLKGNPLPEAAVEKIVRYILQLNPHRHPPQTNPLRGYLEELSRKRGGGEPQHLPKVS